MPRCFPANNRDTLPRQVNVGCVPKKLMFNAASHAEELSDLIDYGLSNIDPSKVTFDWGAVKIKRDAYIKKLNGIYESNLQKSKVEFIEGTGRFIGK